MNIERELKEAPLAVFDFDGTLFNLELDWRAVYEALSLVSRMHGHIGQFRSLTEAYQWAEEVYRAKDQFVHIHNDMEEEGADSCTEIPKGVTAARWRLKNGLPCSILSLNTSSTLMRVIGHWGFYPIIGIDNVQKPKPDPRGLEIILKAHAKDPEEAVFIGNSDIDRECAARGSVKFIHIDDVKEEWFQ